jgi:hypothetical protein
MPVKKQIPYSNGHFFITFTCYNWLPLIEITDSYNIVYTWFDHLTQQGHYITGYTIMPNHFLRRRVSLTSSSQAMCQMGMCVRAVALAVLRR